MSARAEALQVLRDISTPDDGLYSVRDPMEMRLSYVRWQMDNILSDPAIKLSILGKGAPPHSSACTCLRVVRMLIPAISQFSAKVRHFRCTPQLRHVLSVPVSSSCLSSAKAGHLRCTAQCLLVPFVFFFCGIKLRKDVRMC